jgi:F0F1-type ATP synthase assembly protein I
VTSPLKSRSFRSLLLWQALATVAFAILGGVWAGRDGALSGALGAAIVLVANAVYALMGGIIRPATAVGALVLILRAEGFKVGTILLGLLGALVLYRDLVAGPFIAAFIVTTLMFGLALRVRN